MSSNINEKLAVWSFEICVEPASWHAPTSGQEQERKHGREGKVLSAKRVEEKRKERKRKEVGRGGGSRLARVVEKS